MLTADKRIERERQAASDGSNADPIAREFRDAMRRLAIGVSVVTTSHGGRRYGVTVTSFASVCLSPPTLLVCINERASIYEPLIARGAFCLNLLSEHHRDICNVFSQPERRNDRFASGLWLTSVSGLPYLADAQASFFCEVDTRQMCGTHYAVFGRVITVVHQTGGAPLLYHDGRMIGLERGHPQASNDEGVSGLRRFDYKQI